MMYVVCSEKCHAGVMEYPDTFWQVEPQFDDDGEPIPPRRCGNCDAALRPALAEELPPPPPLTPVSSIKWEPEVEVESEPEPEE